MIATTGVGWQMAETKQYQEAKKSGRRQGKRDNVALVCRLDVDMPGWTDEHHRRHGNRGLIRRDKRVGTPRRCILGGRRVIDDLITAIQ